MNNNDLLNKIHNDCENIQPADRLNPEAIEESLRGVKRKKNKGIITLCSTLCVVCIAVLLIHSSGLLNKDLPLVDTELISDTEEGNAESYNEIYKAIKEFNDTNVIYEYSDAGSFSSDVVSSKSDYSTTNVQVEGIDEADFVKTDGKYIYTVCNNKVFISKANNGNPQVISKIKTGTYIKGLYIKDNKVVIIAIEFLEVSDDNATSSVVCGMYGDNSLTKVYIYDVSNIEKPVKESELTQSGYYVSSRMLDNVIYLTSTQGIYNINNIDKDDPTTYCPVYGNGDDLKCVDAKSIAIGENVESVEYLNISSIDLNHCENFADINSVLGAGSEIYTSYDYFYAVNDSYDYKKDKEFTEIFRFSINGTKIKNTGSVNLNGTILNQFSMDEYDGYFRVITETEVYDKATDDYKSVTVLSVLDKNLEIVGTLKIDIGHENIESVRFDEDIAYFVSYENTDPLFTVDLSNPKKPKLLSELKITGFSEYLHPFGNGLLLGFGTETDPNTGEERGLKISMFDVSDKSDVKEITKTVFEDCNELSEYDWYYAESEAEFNHKAIYVDTDSKIVGIPYYTYAEIESNNDLTETEKYYYIFFEYDEDNKKFIELKNIEHQIIENGEYSLLYTRGIKIGDYYYIATPCEIEAYLCDTFEFNGKATLKNR